MSLAATTIKSSSLRSQLRIFPRSSVEPVNVRVDVLLVMRARGLIHNGQSRRNGCRRMIRLRMSLRISQEILRKSAKEQQTWFQHPKRKRRKAKFPLDQYLPLVQQAPCLL